MKDNNKKAFLMHGMSGSMDISFGVRLKEELKKLGYQIFQPNFTIGEDITLESWTKTMDELKAEINDNSIFICHSLSCLFVVKYFAKNNISNKLIIAVAGGLSEESEVKPGFEHLIPFLLTNKEVAMFNKLGNTLYNVYSDNDHIYSLKHLENYNKKLNAVPVLLPNKGHFGASSGVKEVPEIIEIIKKEQK